MRPSIRRLTALALATAGLAGAAAAPAAAAPTVTATADGVRVTGCSVRHILELSLFRRGMSCRQALHRANEAAHQDRWCPRGWRTRARVPLVAKGAKEHPTVTLCRKGGRAFTYHLPTG
ncbi:MAG: hypothetical protein IRZ32_10880 [Solirubrobacteraceae bacterium]|nr:hypothetical protein [Solirubrobacteraceae bacterium]